MDVFQFIADFLHLTAVLMLLLKIISNKNVIGISYKTQEVYLMVFLTRYSTIILTYHWGNLYLNSMRLLFIGITAYTMYIMKMKRPYKLSYDEKSDSFPHYYLYLAAAILAFILHQNFFVDGILWAFSIWLETMAILPQRYMIAKFRDIENTTVHIFVFLGLYRFFYVLHWIYNLEDIICFPLVAGLIQTILYADFIYYFIRNNKKDRFISLPA